ncbi:MAG: response regulator transcription factor [Thermocrispum sp.]
MTTKAAVRAVLVDDHQLVLDGLSRALTRQGMSVLGTFVDGHSALRFLGCHVVDFLVVDLRLRDESGISVVTETHRRHPDIKIAVLTSFDDGGAASSAVRAGATGYLLKDTLTSELSRQLHDVACGHLVIDSRVASAVLAPQQLLSDQEMLVLKLVSEGLTNKEIGARLHLSHYTVKDYLSRIMRKLGTSTRAETVAKAGERSLLRPGGAA